jgi:hypothetical protein
MFVAYLIIIWAIVVTCATSGLDDKWAYLCISLITIIVLRLNWARITNWLEGRPGR